MVFFEDKKRCILKGILSLILYFTFSTFSILVLKEFGFNYNNWPLSYKEIYSLITNIILIFILIYIFKEELKLAVKDIKKNHLNYFNKYFIIYIISVLIMMISNLLIFKLGGTTSDNEISVRNMFERSPIYTYFSAAIIAPFIEEFVFRLGIRNIIKNGIAFILVSGLVFGGLHVIFSLNSFFDLLYLIPYCSCGLAFAYIMYKSNNIFVTTAFHLFHNGLIISGQIILLLF